MFRGVNKKIAKAKGDAPPTELEEEVAKALFDIEVSQTSEIKADLHDIQITSAKEVEVKPGRTAIIIFFPYRVWKNVKRIQSRLIHELEKKFGRRHVVLVAQRTMMKRATKGMKIRPRSRTLTAVHQALLEDVVGPTEIVGKRTRIKAEGGTIIKVHLDPKDKEKDNIEEKLQTFSSVYKTLTGKEAVFTFPEHVY
ncbi:unnamed protein product [Vitrella brassicaformis CCMP3155]|uniref:40S ribosomal protein S7 n=1 Tax=Vitrella brassicaformis (strain CCMP3155) TaxID=1169540 RepID=A0A0G4G7M5_VITBC|nr:unnamed protein product [Vitrella brassicaformis CCMP3155]|eukprot:CEM24409.1 unnamed protein product [Vitrella brassicaformis CCMP3155]